MSTIDNESIANKGKWEKHIDENSGLAYYYNPISGISSWDIPEDYIKPKETEEKWNKYKDEQSGKFYYYDEINERTQWQRPDTYESDSSSSDNDDNMSLKEKSVDEDTALIEHDDEQNDDKQDENSEKSSIEGEDEKIEKNEDKDNNNQEENKKDQVEVKEVNEWQEYIDTSSGKPYYYNIVSKVTQWDKPDDFVSQLSTTQATNGTTSSTNSKLTSLQREKLKQQTQRVLDPEGNIDKLNAILEKIDGPELHLESQDLVESNIDSIWQQHIDPRTKRYYYYNPNTGVTQWDKPEGSIVSGIADWVPADVHDIEKNEQPTVAGVQYVSKAKFNRISGKFEQQDDYWGSMGIANDKAGRQMSHFFDVTDLDKNREEAKRKKEILKRKNINWKKITAEKKMKKLKQKQEWLLTD